MSKINSLESAFERCYSLIKIDLSFIESRLLERMLYVFRNCNNLIEVKLPKNLFGIRYLNSTFENCKKLENVNLDQLYSNDNLIGTQKMFKNCENLKNIKFPQITALQLENMSEMFYGCNKLESIELEFFETRDIINMERMFYNCTMLKYLNIFNFRTKDNVNSVDIFFNVISPININFTEKIRDKNLIQKFKDMNGNKSGIY